MPGCFLFYLTGKPRHEQRCNAISARIHNMPMSLYIRIDQYFTYSSSKWWPTDWTVRSWGKTNNSSLKMLERWGFNQVLSTARSLVTSSKEFLMSLIYSKELGNPLQRSFPRHWSTVVNARRNLRIIIFFFHGRNEKKFLKMTDAHNKSNVSICNYIHFGVSFYVSDCKKTWIFSHTCAEELTWGCSVWVKSKHVTP